MMRKQNIFLLSICLFATAVLGQDKNLTLDSFESPGKSWETVGGIMVNPSDGTYKTEKGTGIFVNLPSKKRQGEDIRTKEEFGDFDLHFEYLMFPGSNSGVYMHGRYEIQLLDSWRKKNVSSGDNGGIYERWIENEQRGYEGHAPRQNASRAPGLWQEMKISFQAPRFDDAGNKTENARILSVDLNGVRIQENVELSGPTRGAWGEESQMGPIRIQGDHGQVAFRNMKIITFDNPVPKLSNLTYAVYEGLVTDMPDFTTMEAVAEGELDIISPSVSSVQGPFLIRYQADLDVPVGGEYEFGAFMNGGGGLLLVDGETVLGPTEWGGNGKVNLDAGIHKIEFMYAKLYDWAATGVGLAVQGPGIRWTSFHDENMNMGTSVDPIYLNAPTVHRSFMDIPGGTRLIRAVSVGSGTGLHYTYDLDHGAVVLGWHGEFLDATPMWHDRGDGSSVPRGAITMIDGNNLIIGQNRWDSDTTGTGFRIRGYTLESPTEPVFKYDIYGGEVTDRVVANPDGGGLSRTITADKPEGIKFAIARGGEIEEVASGLYRIDGKYFVRLGANDSATLAQQPDGRQVLTVPGKSSLSYQIIF